MKLLRKIKIYHLTGNCEDPKVKKIIEIFDDICNVEYYSDEYPKSVFYKYKGKIYFELDLKNDITRCRYMGFWKKFETEFGLNSIEIRKLIQYMLGIHLKRKVPATKPGGWRLIPPTPVAAFNSAKLGMHLKSNLDHIK